MPPMKLPESSEKFTKYVIADSRRLIEIGLWDIGMSRLDSWLKQFCGPEETFFAACILDQLIFRTNQQFESSLHSIFRSNLNGMLEEHADDLTLTSMLSGTSDPKLRLVPVIRENDPPTKSGPLVLRKLQRLLKIRPKWMCWPWQVPHQVVEHGVHTIIFIDDMLGTGAQFEAFYEQWKFSENASAINYYYVPVVAHVQGIDRLSKSLSAVKIATAEVLEDAHGFFSEETWHTLSHGTITANTAQEWYVKFATSKGITPHANGTLGLGGLALSFAFSHSTPNNTLPILWYSRNGWQPLLER